MYQTLNKLCFKNHVGHYQAYSAGGVHIHYISTTDLIKPLLHGPYQLYAPAYDQRNDYLRFSWICSLEQLDQ